MAPLTNCSTLGCCAPTAAMEQPSQLMPASQNACTSVIGPVSSPNAGVWELVSAVGADVITRGILCLYFARNGN